MNEYKINNEACLTTLESLTEDQREKISVLLEDNINQGIKNSKLEYETIYTFILNLAFDKINPAKYVLVKGFYVIQKKETKEEVRDIIYRFLTSINISNNPDDFLDNVNSIKQEADGNEIMLLENLTPTKKRLK